MTTIPQLATALQTVLSTVANAAGQHTHFVQRPCKAKLTGSTAMTARLVAGVMDGGAPALTPRELEVLRLMGQGLSNNEIALRLQIAPRTTKVHVQNILGKLGATNRTEAVSMAVRRQLISLS